MTEPIAEAPSRVLSHLIRPLEALGLEKPPRMTRREFDAMRARLERRLDHMSAAGLEALQGWIAERAGGALKDRWPKEITILNVARSIEPEPDNRRLVVSRYMASQHGRDALTRGPHRAAALLRYVQTLGIPGGGWSWGKVSAYEDEIGRTIAKLERLRDDGDPSAEPELFKWAAHFVQVRKLVYPPDGDADSQAGDQ